MGCNTSQEQKSSVNEGEDAVGVDEKQDKHTTGDDNNDKKSEKKSAKSLKSDMDNGQIDANASKNEGEIFSLFVDMQVKYELGIWVSANCTICVRL